MRFFTYQAGVAPFQIPLDLGLLNFGQVNPYVQNLYYIVVVQ